MSEINFEIVNNEPEKQLQMNINGHQAVLIYRFYKKSIALMHTTVPYEMEHHGIGGSLARAAFEYAASINRLVRIYCPFISEYVNKHPEYKAQLDPSFH